VSDLSAWILSIGLFLGVVVLTALAAKSVAGDPARGRRRCPRCWHELGPIELDPTSDSAVPSRRCAECGFTALREGDTMRTRRKPVRAALAILGVVALVLAARARFIGSGAWSIAPTAVLMAAVPWVDSTEFDSPIRELARRIGSATLDDGQIDDALGLVIAGDSGARPPTREWQAKYGLLCDTLMLSVRRDDPRLLRLLEIPPAIELVALMGGERGAHALALDVAAWWPSGLEGEAEVRLPDGSSVRAAFDPWGRNAPWLVELPAGVSPEDPFSFELRVRQRGLAAEDAPDGGWNRYETVEGSATRVAGRGAGEPDAEPFDSAELRAAIAAVFDFDDAFVLWSRGTPRGGLRFNERATADPAFADTLIGLRIEVCEDGVPRRTSRIWWPAGPGVSRPRWFAPEEDADALERLHAADPESDGRWTLRIVGDSALADLARPPLGERPTRAFRSWSGSFEVPLRIHRIAQPSPSRRWTPVSAPTQP
jgi:hypothetical protein